MVMLQKPHSPESTSPGLMEKEAPKPPPCRPQRQMEVRGLCLGDGAVLLPAWPLAKQNP